LLNNSSATFVDDEVDRLGRPDVPPRIVDEEVRSDAMNFVSLHTYMRLIAGYGLGSDVAIRDEKEIRI
jgi:hypothetical protein